MVQICMGWMRRITILGCLAALPVTASAAPSNDAKALEKALNSLTTVALNAADDAAKQGANLATVRRDNVADEASILRFAVHRQVFRAIVLGYSNLQVNQQLQSLQNDLMDLDNAVSAKGTGLAIFNAYKDVLTAWDKLENSLAGVGTNSFVGSCVGKFGGNFFNKKTHVECSAKGLGAFAYRVEFQNQVSGQTVSATVKGLLSPLKFHQTFSSQSVSVGNYAQFRVYVVDKSNTSHLVATGQASGNPF